MGNSFRMQPAPTLYGDNKTAVSEDLLEVGLLVAFGFIAFSFILIIPGIRGWERLFATVRVGVALWVGAVILVSNFGYGWYVGNARVQAQYKAFTTDEIIADVGLHVGLRALNITLKGAPLDPNGDLRFEEIDYNERFSWADPWAQGRLGFGRFAGRYNQEFRAAQFRGMPYPILWIAEYFTLDGEQIRWGRKFRVAGWYTHIFLWTAFALYLLDILIFIFNVRFGTIYMTVTGLVMLMAVFAFGMLVYNAPPVRIPWNRPSYELTNNADDCRPDPNNGEWCAIIMEPTYGWSFYLTLFTGLAVTGVGFILYLIDFFAPRYTAPLFHHNVIEEDEEFFEDQPNLEEVSAALDDSGYGRRQRGGRGRTQRGLTKYRQTTRRPRSTIRSKTGSQRLRNDETGIPLTELKNE